MSQTDKRENEQNSTPPGGADGSIKYWYPATVAPNDAPKFADATPAQKRAFGWATDDDGTIDGEATEYSIVTP